MPQFSSIIGVGIPGATGPAGPPGDDGSPGATGPQGPPGPGADLSDTAAAALGVAAAGTSAESSRADHVHPMPNAAAVGAMATVASTDGGVMVYAGGAWASTGAGTARQVLTSGGASAAGWGNQVVPLRIGYTGAVALDAEQGIGFARNAANIVFRNAANTAWLNLVGLDGSGFVVLGTTDATDASGTIVYAPAAGEIYFYRGAQAHLFVNSAGAMSIGHASYSTTIRGSEITFDAITRHKRAPRVDATTEAAATHTLTLGSVPALRMTNAGARTVTLFAPAAADADLEWRIHDAARTADSAAITVTAPAGVTLNGVTAGSVTINTKGGALIVRVVGLNAWETVGL